MSNNISTDFSSPEIMLYFYFNSNEISKYLYKSFSHFGDYNFQKYLLDKKSENVENNDDEKVWEVQVKNGKYHGFYKEWYDGGNLKLKQAYNKNKRHGNNILYWDIQDSSNIRESGNYKQDHLYYLYVH